MNKKPLQNKPEHKVLISKRGTIYYLEDPDSKTGTTPVKEHVMLEAVLSIAKKQGLIITDEMILYEINGYLY